jgi:hypothetical protein
LSDSEIIEVTAECVAQRVVTTPPLPERRTRGALTRIASREWIPGDAPKTMRHPRVGNAVAFLDGALITVFGKDTTSAQPFAGLDAPE